MWILKDFINDNIIPLLPWALLILALVIFCVEFVWTDKKILTEGQKDLVKSLFSCFLAAFLTIYWEIRILPQNKEWILIFSILLPSLIFFNNNFLKKHVIPKDWQVILYICLIYPSLAVKSPCLILAGTITNSLLYILADARSSKTVNKNVKELDNKKVKKNKTLYGGLALFVISISIALVFSYEKKAPITFLSMIVLTAIAAASFIIWYIFNDKERIHWFAAFECLCLFAPFLYNPFEHFWIGSAVTIAALPWDEYFSLILSKKLKKDRFFLFSLGLEVLTLALSLGIIFAGFHYQTLPTFAILAVDLASILALFLYYVIFGNENYWIYTLLTILLVSLALFTSPFGSFWIVSAALCLLLPLIIAAFREKHWLLITALAALMAAVAWLCLMVLSGQMDLDKIFSHVHIFGAITGKGAIQADIIPFALQIGLVPALCIAIPLILELTFGSIIFVKKLRRK
ncbi:MAG: hypothetical protein K5873_04805 [Treponema sp.]|nr:hypothetical protein [Treponema sp.]